MIEITLFVGAASMYIFANYWRERTMSRRGASRPRGLSTLLMFNAICLAIGAVVLSVVHMITFISAA
jgi:predicted PurR-regulated permease PerM